MIDINRLYVRFIQFGGIRLVWQYIKMGVLWTGIGQLLLCMVKGRSLKMVYPVLTKNVDRILVASYSNLLDKKDLYSVKDRFVDESKRVSNSIVWFCWLQGIDQAPEMVKVCLASQQNMFGVSNVLILDDQNYKEWIQLPEYVEEKYKKGWIPPACFSDLIRLELLINYGGTWIDSSVLVTKLVDGVDYLPTIDEILNSDLFVFRSFKNGRELGISNWFIHASPQNPLLKNVRDMLYAYWRDYNCTVEYYIFHLFFSLAAQRYPEMIRKMPKGNSYHSIILGKRLSATYDEIWWRELIKHVIFHKINYRQEKSARENSKSYWNHILDCYKASAQI